MMIRQRSINVKNKHVKSADQTGSKKQSIYRKGESGAKKNCRNQLRSYTSSRKPYFYRSRSAHLQVSMADSTSNTNRSKDQKSKTSKLKSDSHGDYDDDRDPQNGENGKKCSLQDNELADQKSTTSATLHDSGDDKTWNSKSKELPGTKEKPEFIGEGENQLRAKTRHQERQCSIKNIHASKSNAAVRQHPYRRPQRNIIPKKEGAYGLLWKEEAALQRALNASIQAQRHKDSPYVTPKNKLPPKFSPSHSQPNHYEILSCETKPHKTNFSSYLDSDVGEDYVKMAESDIIIDEDFGHNFTFIGSDSSLSEKGSDKKKRVRAQRKFAASSSQLEILNLIPNKWNSVCQSQKFLNTNGKTEDFLTFLCLRRSSILPAHLECFKYNEGDSLASFPNSPPASHASSCPGTPVSLPTTSGDVSLSLTGTHDQDATTAVRQILFKKTDAKRQNKSFYPNRNLWKSHSFHSSLKTQVRKNELRRVIRSTPGKQGATANVSDSSVLSSSDISHPAAKNLCRTLFDNHVETASDRTGIAAKSINSTKTGTDGPLKNRLRATTKALSAAVIKEQLMFAKRSLDKQFPMTQDKQELEKKLESGKVRITRSNSRNLDGVKKDLDTSQTISAISDKATKKVIEKNPRKQRLDDQSAPAECSQSSQPVERISLSICRPKNMSNDNSGDGMECGNCSASCKSNNSFADIAEVPIFHPTAENLQDFLTYVNECSKTAQNYGICRIVPPDGWKMDCNVSQELRFTPQTQYIHKMTRRWGPNVQQLACLSLHIESQGGSLENIPLFGGVETDMVALSQAIQLCGGIHQVVDKNKWPKVAEMLHIPAVAKEKSARLYEIYCRYLLSYDTLSAEEKKKLEEKVLSKRERNPFAFDQRCIVKSRAKTLSEFFCTARNTQSMYFHEDPQPTHVQKEYWRLAEEQKYHVAVQTGHIDSWHSSGTRSSTTRKKDAVASKDEHSLKTLVQNHPNLLSHLEPVSGVNEPVLNIGMLFSTLCWSRDPHFLPRLYYLHTGSDIIWYSIPASEESRLKSLMEELVPDLIEGKLLSWLPSDSVMISPEVLHRRGIRVFRTVQHQGQFVVVFPESFSASIGCGYNIVEHVNFIYSPDWLQVGCKACQVERLCHPCHGTS